MNPIHDNRLFNRLPPPIRIASKQIYNLAAITTFKYIYDLSEKHALDYAYPERHYSSLGNETTILTFLAFQALLQTSSLFALNRFAGADTLNRFTTFGLCFFYSTTQYAFPSNCVSPYASFIVAAQIYLYSHIINSFLSNTPPKQPVTLKPNLMIDPLKVYGDKETCVICWDSLEEKKVVITNTKILMHLDCLLECVSQTGTRCPITQEPILGFATYNNN